MNTRAASIIGTQPVPMISLSPYTAYSRFNQSFPQKPQRGEHEPKGKRTQRTIRIGQRPNKESKNMHTHTRTQVHTANLKLSQLQEPTNAPMGVCVCVMRFSIFEEYANGAIHARHADAAKRLGRHDGPRDWVTIGSPVTGSSLTLAPSDWATRLHGRGSICSLPLTWDAQCLRLPTGSFEAKGRVGGFYFLAGQDGT